MTTSHVYDEQAKTYDATRAASPSVLRPLRQALSGAPGRELLDVGGGTGNYAAALRDDGWRPLVVDLNARMLARAVAKDLPTLRADAAALPVGDASVDAVMLVSMLHHVPDWRTALAEARRVLRPDGRLALMTFAREHTTEATWLRDYFPVADEWMVPQHLPLATVEAELPGCRIVPFVFSDLEDASLGALQHHPGRLLEESWRRQTSYFEKLAARDPDALAAGLDRLRADLDAGIDPNDRIAVARERFGDAVVIAWTKPA